MEIEGKIKVICPATSGISQSTGNTWKKQEFVLDYFWWPNQQEASQMVFSIMGEERIKEADLHVMDEVRIQYHFEAREYNGRWYNEVRCTRVTKIGASAKSSAQPQQLQHETQQPTQQTNDVIPF